MFCVQRMIRWFKRTGELGQPIEIIEVDHATGTIRFRAPAWQIRPMFALVRSVGRGVHRQGASQAIRVPVSMSRRLYLLGMIHGREQQNRVVRSHV